MGNFELDRRLDWYEGKTEWNGGLIDIYLAGELEKIDNAENNAISILQNQKDFLEHQ